MSNPSDVKATVDRVKQLPPSVQYAIVTVVPNIINGAFWGFTDMQDIQEHTEQLKQDKNIVARKLGNSCLIEVEPSYLLKAVQAGDPNAITKKDVDVMQNAIAEAKHSFNRFLIQKGKTAEPGKLFAGTIGIYCTNNVTTISYRGVNYPAFRVNIADALTALNYFGYEIRVGGQFVNPMQASNMGQALWESLSLSPTKTGIFMNIRCKLTPEQMKVKEAEYKASVK